MADILRDLAASVTSLVTGQQGIYTQLNENMQKLSALSSGVVDMVDTPPGTPEDPGVYIIVPSEYTLASTDEGSNFVTYTGDLTSRIAEDDVIILEKSDGTMKQFTVTSITYSSPTTTIYTSESISGGSWANKMHHADGVFNSHEFAIAHYYDSGWHYYDPTTGKMFFVLDVDGVSTDKIYYFDGNEWVQYS